MKNDSRHNYKFHADLSSIAERRESIIETCSSSKSQAHQIFQKLLALGYISNAYYVGKEQKEQRLIQAITLQTDQSIAHISAALHAVQLENCHNALPDIDTKTKTSLNEHIYLPFKLATQQFIASTEENYLEYIESVLEKVTIETPLEWIKATIPGDLFHDSKNPTQTLEQLQKSLIPDYEAALRATVVTEEKLQSIDSQVTQLGATIDQRYQPESAKHQACLHLIRTYETFRYLLLTHQYQDFLYHLGCSEKILEPLRQHKTRLGWLFSCHTPSIVDSVKNILISISDSQIDTQTTLSEKHTSDDEDTIIQVTI